MEINWKAGIDDHMKVRKTNGVCYLTYPAFEEIPEIVHGFSTRLGGSEQGGLHIHEPELCQRRP